MDGDGVPGKNDAVPMHFLAIEGGHGRGIGGGGGGEEKTGEPGDDQPGTPAKPGGHTVSTGGGTPVTRVCDRLRRD